jgi:hypothetical protein
VKAFVRQPLGLAIACAWLFVGTSARAGSPHVWQVSSPNHEQTFAYGTERNRVWTERGRDRHLAVMLSFTNDPYVDSLNPRRYDKFTFSFPKVTLDKDGHTFSYRAPDGRSVPVADKRTGFLGTDEVRLLPNAFLIVNGPHGYLSLALAIEG